MATAFPDMRGLLSPLLSLLHLSLQRLCPLPRSVCPLFLVSAETSLHLQFLQTPSPTVQPSQTLQCFSEATRELTELRFCFLDLLLWTYKYK